MRLSGCPEPFVEGGGWFRHDRLFEGSAFFFQFGDVVPNRDEHLVEVGELRLVADGAVAGDDDGVPAVAMSRLFLFAMIMPSMLPPVE